MNRQRTFGLTLALSFAWLTTFLSLPVHAVDADLDSDGMPDWWEYQYSGTTTGLQANADLDGDGLDNLAEWNALSNPTNATSRFEITGLNAGASSPVVQWTSASNRTYSLDWTTNLVTGFSTPFASSIPATFPVNAYTDSTPAHVTMAGFYRLHGQNQVTTTNSCLVCHNQIQGTRSAVVLDFTNRSHHVQTAVANSDCRVCHETSLHQTGNVRVKNADTPSTVYTLSGDPLSSSTEAAKLTPLCLSCHDANGAGGAAPFSDSQMPPVRDGTAWTASAHNVNGMSCFGEGQTFGCHATLHGSKKLNILAPYTVAPGTDNAGEEEGFCYSCHDGSPAPSVTNDFAKTVRHPVVNSDIKRGSGRSVECIDCHSTHVAQVATGAYTNIATSTRNQVGNPSKGVSGWAVNYAGLTSFQAPANGDYSTVSSATYQYEICFKCHSGKSWSFGTPPNGLSANGSVATPAQTDLAQEFSPRNMSGHPVVTGLTYYANAVAPLGLTTARMKTPWNNASNIGTQTMKCTDCHDTDSVSPAAQGPHGSAAQYMLRGSNAANWPNVTMSNIGTSWCSNCHSPDTNIHSSGKHSLSCYECHIVIPHGGNISRLMADRDGSMPSRYAYNNDKNTIQMLGFRKASSYNGDNQCNTQCGDHTYTGTGSENW